MSKETVLIGFAFALVALGGSALWYAFGCKGTAKKRRFIGTVGCLACCAVLAAIVGLMLPIFRSAVSAAKDSPCVWNMTEMGKAFMMYAGDNNERMPLSAWTDAVGGYIDKSSFTCPRLVGPYGYTLNSAVVGLDTRTVYVNLTVSAFDGPGGKDHVGGADSVAYRHPNDSTVIGFLDGHARRIRRSDMPSLARQLTGSKG